jgi:hypothetical protein
MTALNAFCNQLIAFFEDLSETYPEEKDIASAAQALKLIKQANPRLIHSVFMKNVFTEFSQHILDEDEEYVIGRAKEIMRTTESHIKYAFLIFDKHWSTMSETNKQYVWKYIKSLVLLAARVS